MLNDDDKRYLKNNIENRLDKLDAKVGKVEASSKRVSQPKPDTEAGKKLADLLKQSQEKDDKEKLLEELKDRDTRGENTLAQKMELLSLTLKTAIPEDVQDALKDLNKTVKDGANQAGKGIAHLTQKVMMSNPLTAMLYQNRDLLKAGWDITAGTAKMGWGVAKGIGKGTMGILNSAANLFKKKEKPVEEEDEKPSEVGRVAVNSETEIEEETNTELSTAQKITDLHEYFIKGKFLQKQEAEEKKRNSILAKGLNGLNESMKMIGGVAEMIMAKQKLILGTLLVGAVGVLALAGWFKNGGLTKAIKGILGFDKDGTDNDSSTFVPKTISTDDLDSGLSGDAWKNAVTAKTNNNDFTDISNVENNALGTWKANDTLSKKGLQAFQVQGNDSSKDMVIRAPFNCYINNVEFVARELPSGDKGYYRMYIEEVHTKKQGVSDVSWSEFEYCIYPVFDPKFTQQPKNEKRAYKVVPKGTILGYAHGQYYIVPRNKEAYTHFEDKVENFVKDENTEFENKYKDSIQKTGDFRTDADVKAVRKNYVDNGQALKYSENFDKAQGFWEKRKTELAALANEGLQFAGGDAYDNIAYEAVAPKAIKIASKPSIPNDNLQQETPNVSIKEINTPQIQSESVNLNRVSEQANSLKPTQNDLTEQASLNNVTAPQQAQNQINTVSIPAQTNTAGNNPSRFFDTNQYVRANDNYLH